jgi:hypothetical protein
VLGGDLDLARGNPEQRLAVDDEPGQLGRRYRRVWPDRRVASGDIPACWPKQRR